MGGGRTLGQLPSLSFSLWRPVVWLHAAEAAFGAGDAVQAEACARQGLCEVDAGRDALFAPELHRVLATALQAQGAPGAVVEAAYEKALSIACDYDAKLFELRTAVDLAGHWRRQDRSTEASTLLQNIYSGFSDGFDIPLFIRANRLLENL